MMEAGAFESARQIGKASVVGNSFLELPTCNDVAYNYGSHDSIRSIVDSLKLLLTALYSLLVRHLVIANPNIKAAASKVSGLELTRLLDDPVQKANHKNMQDSPGSHHE